MNIANNLTQPPENIGSSSLGQILGNLDVDLADCPQAVLSESEATNSDSDEANAQSRASKILIQLEMSATRPFPNSDSEEPEEFSCSSCIENIAFTQQLITEIKCATIDGDRLDSDVLETLRNPIEEPVDISDQDTRLALDVFLACNNASEATYNAVRAACRRWYPNNKFLSYYSAKKLVSEISGVNSIVDDMCINSCMAYVEPWANLQQCSQCSEPRYDTKKLGKQVPRQQVCTIPLGPQL